jgi:ribosomal protein S18 acetylase RimI-like enzyme
MKRNRHDLTIREVASDDDLRKAARIIRASFRTVADEFGLTKKNCPAHPAFITLGRLRKMTAQGLRLFALDDAGEVVGIVGSKRLDDERHTLEKLCVPPGYRHRGHGRRLVEFVCAAAKRGGGRLVEIGTIDEHALLKRWYADQGFVAKATSGVSCISGERS